MKNTRSENSKGNEKSKTSDGKEREVDVLYQRLGNKVFAFSLIDNEVFVGSIPANDVDATSKKKSKSKKIAGNS